MISHIFLQSAQLSILNMHKWNNHISTWKWTFNDIWWFWKQKAKLFKLSSEFIIEPSNALRIVSRFNTLSHAWVTIQWPLTSPKALQPDCTQILIWSCVWCMWRKHGEEQRHPGSVQIKPWACEDLNPSGIWFNHHSTPSMPHTTFHETEIDNWKKENSQAPDLAQIHLPWLKNCHIVTI